MRHLKRPRRCGARGFDRHRRGPSVAYPLESRRLQSHHGRTQIMISPGRTVAARAGAASAALIIGFITLPVTPALAQNQPNRIRIEYEPATNPEFQPIYESLKQRQALEKLQELFSPFKLPADLTIKAKQCGMSNAWYQRPTLTICYEYLDDVRKNTPKETTPEGITPTDAI